MRYSIAIIAMFAASACHLGTATPKLDVESESATVQNDVRAMSDALFSGDVSGLTERLYPGLIEKLGGAKAVDTLYEGVIAAQKRAGIERESITFPTAPEFIQGKSGRRFALVSSRIVISGKGARGAASGYHLGVKEDGAKAWKYIPGQFLRPDIVPTLLPDFPADHPLPPRSTEKLPSRGAAPADS